jgi:hypothetical protein
VWRLASMVSLTSRSSLIRLHIGERRQESSCLGSYQGLVPLVRGWLELLLKVSLLSPPVDGVHVSERSPLMVAISLDDLEGAAQCHEVKLVACSLRAT